MRQQKTKSAGAPAGATSAPYKALPEDDEVSEAIVEAGRALIDVAVRVHQAVQQSKALVDRTELIVLGNELRR